MFRHYWPLALALFSFQALAQVSLEEKENRVQFLRELQENNPQMDIAAYERELSYEKQELSVEERAKNEARLMAEKIQQQIIKSYETLREEKSDEDAALEIRAQIEKDTSLMDEEMQNDIQTFSLKILDEAQRGIISSNNDLASLETYLIDDINERMSYLNEDGPTTPILSAAANENLTGTTKRNADAERNGYSSTQALVQSLTSTKESTRFASTSNSVLRTGYSKKLDSEISLRVRAEFLGSEISAGPTLVFQREFSSQVAVMPEGLTPALLSNGRFDFRSEKNKKRYIAFWCELSLDFETKLAAGATISFMGAGGGTKVTKTYKNSVSMNSRRVLVPESIHNRPTTINDLAKICSTPFLMSKISGNMTVRDSLNISLKNIVRGLVYSHPKSKCGVDAQCVKWFKSGFSLRRDTTYPRCVEDKKEHFFGCELRALQGESCPLYKGGKKVSYSINDVPCDYGLKCVDAGGLLNKGVCRPANPRTYKAPRAIR